MNMLNLKKTGVITAGILALSGCFGSDQPGNNGQVEKLKSSLSQSNAHQPEITRLDKRLVLMETAGLMKKKTSMVKLMEQYVEPRLVDLNSGQFIDDTERLENYDAEVARTDPSLSVSLAEKDDYAGLKRRENIAKVFLIKDEQGRYDRVALPVRAFGKFSLLQGYLALELDNLSISGLGFYQHAETPGLGGKIIDEPEWVQQFIGKQIFSEGKPDFQVVVNHRQVIGDHSVDGISGATLTSHGVQNALNFWCGEQGFGPFLRNLKISVG
ncbi:NADH:ubiquinone reductase (Na(+)-transporting) subunit C [Vibrio albus]|uniref:Na(+)-translocating NADH-quinone reductase subunit C n=1 Tax=Vibrio albus TaxID=2200953 RepID=A0A2U3B914_9VIBR|nr:NADH:ubiquinone reductase (Na(+)-transporting) subunit C [Vibrio albus]PWI33278.1 NADH:ubiquinone reductase (Na(+)-transporting) subunit C [Vibrio albus]